MPLRITGHDGEPIVDVTGTDGLPRPVGYIDAAGAFHKEPPRSGGSEALYSQRDLDRVIEQLKRETEIRHWNHNWR